MGTSGRLGVVRRGTKDGYGLNNGVEGVIRGAGMYEKEGRKGG